MGKFVISKAASGFKFNLKAGNGEIIGVSEVYNTLAACKNGCESVAKNAPEAAIEDQTKAGFATEKNPKFEIYKDKKGETRFRLKASNGQVILTGEGYSSTSACLNGVESIRKNADSPIVEG